MTILQEDWSVTKDGLITKQDGTVVSSQILDQNHAFLMSKAPELWRNLTQAQNQL